MNRYLPLHEHVIATWTSHAGHELSFIHRVYRDTLSGYIGDHLVIRHTRAARPDRPDRPTHDTTVPFDRLAILRHAVDEFETRSQQRRQQARDAYERRQRERYEARELRRSEAPETAKEPQ